MMEDGKDYRYFYSGEFSSTIKRGALPELSEQNIMVYHYYGDGDDDFVNIFFVRADEVIAVRPSNGCPPVPDIYNLDETPQEIIDKLIEAEKEIREIEE
jgi:hypothetical protein